MDIILNQLPRIQHLSKDWTSPNCSIEILRLDEIHPKISGNKWYKLKENITSAIENNCKSVLSFGGAYSNHLIATAVAAKANNLQSIGIVRGLYAKKKLTPTLIDCMANGMQLVFVTKEEYSQKEDKTYLDNIAIKYPNCYIIPEGGANFYGRKGIEQLASQIPKSYSHICTSVGTGTTLAGICNGVGDNPKVMGYAPMKGGVYLKEQIDCWTKKVNWQIYDDWHFGGFGKWTDSLVVFMNDFFTINRIPLDMVYTAKMMFAVKQQVEEGVFPSKSKILCVHTGGLQGNISIAKKLMY